MCNRQRAKNGRKFLESLRESFSEKMCVCVLHKSRASDLEQRERARERAEWESILGVMRSYGRSNWGAQCGAREMHEEARLCRVPGSPTAFEVPIALHRVAWVKVF